MTLFFLMRVTLETHVSYVDYFVHSENQALPWRRALMCTLPTRCKAVVVGFWKKIKNKKNNQGFSRSHP